MKKEELIVGHDYYYLAIDSMSKKEFVQEVKLVIAVEVRDMVLVRGVGDRDVWVNPEFLHNTYQLPKNVELFLNGEFAPKEGVFLDSFVPAKWGYVHIPVHHLTAENMIIDMMQNTACISQDMVSAITANRHFFSPKFQHIFFRDLRECHISFQENTSQEIVKAHLPLVTERPIWNGLGTIVSFEDYYKTEVWMFTRLIMLKFCHSNCSLCGSNQNLQVHHKTYQRIGCESILDLSVLCKTCHTLWHKAKKGSGIYQSAKDFISAFRALEKHF